MANRKDTVVRFLTLPVPANAPSDYTDGAFCIKVSGEWLSYLMGLTSAFRVRSLWEHHTGVDWQNISLWTDELSALVGVCDDKPDAPPQEEKPPVIINPTGGTSQIVGSMGYTIEELEGMLQMAITKIENRPDGLWYRDGCCDWFKVLNADGSPLGGLTGTNTKPVDQWTLQEWADAGKPSLPSVGVIPHSNPAYTTEDSIRCAKASALAAYLYGTNAILKATFTALAATTPPFSAAAVGTALISAGVTGGWSIVASAAVLIGGYIVGQDLEDMVAEIEAWENGDHLASFICTLTGAVYPGEKIEEIDVDQTIKYWLVEIGEDQNHWIFDMLRVFPVQWWKLGAQQLVAQQECGCNNYLPFGYEVPIPEGTLEFNFVQFAEGFTWGQTPLYAAGYPYADAFDGTKYGTLVNGRPKGQKNVSTGTDHESHFSAHYHLSSPAILDSIKATWSFPAGEAAVRMHCFALRTLDNTWQWCGGAYVDESAPFTTTFTSTGGGVEVSDVIVTMNTYYPAAGVEKPTHLTALLLSGSFNGVAFSELGIGEQFTP